MPDEKGDRWIVADLIPGVRSVRFTRPSLCGDGQTVFRELWDRLLEGVKQGDVVILNFQQVQNYDSCFLTGLFRAGFRLKQRGGIFYRLPSLRRTPRNLAGGGSQPTDRFPAQLCEQRGGSHREGEASARLNPARVLRRTRFISARQSPCSVIPPRRRSDRDPSDQVSFRFRFRPDRGEASG